MNQIAINTSQNVNVNFNVASIGERMLAFIIDTLIKVAFMILILYVLNKLLNFDKYFDTLDPWSIMAILSLITLPAHIYTLAFESLMEGQTPGKRLMKIKVVKIDGYQASFGDYIMRWVFRLIDIFSFSGIVGLVSMIVSNNNQRLGDMATGTAVISLKNNINISHTILENLNEGYVPTFPQVIGLSDNDMRIIKNNFVKASAINDRTVITRLTEKIRELLKIDFETQKMTEREFITTIIKDYNFYTGKDQ